jgi:hypothetical protein
VVLAAGRAASIIGNVFVDELFQANGGLATAQQLQTVMSRRSLAYHVKTGAIVRVWRGIYALGTPDVFARLAGLDLLSGKRMVACMGTAAELHGFNTECDEVIHVLDPGVRMRPTAGLMVHQRVGARLQRVGGRLATAPAWTAVEVARTLRRPRALAVLDAALHCRACTREEFDAAIDEQKGRRGIVNVRELVVHADGRAESAMESEADWCSSTAACRCRNFSTKSSTAAVGCGESISPGRKPCSPWSTTASNGTRIQILSSTTGSRSPDCRNAAGLSCR